MNIPKLEFWDFQFLEFMVNTAMCNVFAICPLTMFVVLIESLI